MLLFSLSFLDHELFNFKNSLEVTNGMPIIVFVLICTSLYFILSYYGMFLPTAIVAAILATAFKIKYLRHGWGVELAYWGLAYAALAIVILGVGLVQSHYGCTFLLGDCYQPRLPQWISSMKLFLGLYVLTLNSVALYRVVTLVAPRAMIPGFYGWFRKDSGDK